MASDGTLPGGRIDCQHSAVSPLLGSVLWIIPGILGVGIAAIIWVAATYRYRDAHNESMGRAPSGLPGGGLVLFISCVTAATGCIGISAVLLLAAS